MTGLIIYLFGIIYTYAFCEYMMICLDKDENKPEMSENLRKNRLYLIILWPLLMIGFFFGMILSFFPKIELPKWVKDKLDRE